MTNLDSVFITLPTKVHIYSQSYGLPIGHVWLWELDHKEGRVLKNWCLQIVVLEKTPESSLDSTRSNQSILRESNPEYLLEGLMLKLHYFGHLMRTDDSLEKSLMLTKTEGRRRRGHQRMRWLGGITDQWTWTWANFGTWWGTGRPGMLQSMGSHRVRHDWAIE